MSRNRLPNRRPNETVDFQHDGAAYAVTVGFDPSNRPAEIFAQGAKVGSAMDGMLDDACIAISLLLQHGVEPAKLARTMGRLGDGRQPASIIGALVDRLRCATSELPTRACACMMG